MFVSDMGSKGWVATFSFDSLIEWFEDAGRAPDPDEVDKLCQWVESALEDETGSLQVEGGELAVRALYTWPDRKTTRLRLPPTGSLQPVPLANLQQQCFDTVASIISASRSCRQQARRATEDLRAQQAAWAAERAQMTAQLQHLRSAVDHQVAENNKHNRNAADRNTALIHKVLDHTTALAIQGTQPMSGAAAQYTQGPEHSSQVPEPNRGSITIQAASSLGKRGADTQEEAAAAAAAAAAGTQSQAEEGAPGSSVGHNLGPIIRHTGRGGRGRGRSRV